MSSVEAAASLFGSEDFASDPFSSVLGSEEHAPTAAEPLADDLFGNTSGTDFDIVSDPFQPADVTHTNDEQGWYGAENGYDYSANPQAATGVAGNGGDHDGVQGWQNQANQHQNYSQPSGGVAAGYGTCD